MNKRGQGLSITSIILIVLGVLILVFLIVGFSLGWSKVLPWIKPTNNVQTISDSCKLACSTQTKYDYCSKKLELKAEDEVLKDVNCNFLAEIKTVYGIEKCPSISCDNIPIDGNVVDCTGNAGKTIEYLDASKVLQTAPCP